MNTSFKFPAPSPISLNTPDSLHLLPRLPFSLLVWVKLDPASFAAANLGRCTNNCFVLHCCMFYLWGLMLIFLSCIVFWVCFVEVLILLWATLGRNLGPTKGRKYILKINSKEATVDIFNVKEEEREEEGMTILPPPPRRLWEWKKKHPNPHKKSAMITADSEGQRNTTTPWGRMSHPGGWGK